MIELANRVIPIRVDGRAEEAVVERFGASWPGDLLLLAPAGTPDGEPVTHLGPDVRANELVHALEESLDLPPRGALEAYALSLGPVEQEELAALVGASPEELLAAGHAGYVYLAEHTSLAALPPARRALLTPVLDELARLETEVRHRGLDHDLDWLARVLTGPSEERAALAHRRVAQLVGDAPPFRAAGRAEGVLRLPRDELADFLPRWSTLFADRLRYDRAADRYRFRGADGAR